MMKSERPHRIPLSTGARAVLEQARASYGDTGIVFPAERSKRAMGGKILSSLLAELDIPGVPHGFRSSFKDWSLENGIEWHVSEACLAHALGNATEIAYARSNLFNLRREAMDAWDKHVNHG